jgi:hypothetical protein
MSGATNQISGSPRMASGSKGHRGLGRWVGTSISVASPRTTSVSRLPFWLSSAAGRSVAAERVVAQNRRTDNNGLERTRSRADGLREPCRSIQC